MRTYDVIDNSELHTITKCTEILILIRKHLRQSGQKGLAVEMNNPITWLEIMAANKSNRLERGYEK